LKFYRNISTATILLKGVCTLRATPFHRFYQHQPCAKLALGRSDFA